MPRAVTPATRTLYDGLRAFYAKHAKALADVYDQVGRPAVPANDDDALRRFHRLLESARRDKYVLATRQPPTPADIDHLASIWLWRTWWRTSKRHVELLPIWLAIQGYPIATDIFVQSCVAAFERRIPRAIMFGTEEDRVAWAENGGDDAARSRATKHRQDPLRAVALQGLTTEYQADRAASRPVRAPGVTAQRWAGLLRTERAQESEAATQALRTSEQTWLLFWAGGDVDPEDLVADTDAVLRHATTPYPVDLDVVLPRMTSYPAVLNYFEGQPDTAAVLRETVLRWDGGATVADLSDTPLTTQDQQLVECVYSACCYLITDDIHNQAQHD